VFSFFAAVGGAVVLVGLWMEWKSHKDGLDKTDWFADTKAFRKSKRRTGEILVMVGVGLEIVMATLFATLDVCDKYKINKQAAASDPRNLPVNAVSGYAIIEVRAKGEREINLAKNLHQILENREGINFDLTTSTKLEQNPESVLLFFGKSPLESLPQSTGAIEIVGWIDSVNTIASDSKPYAPNLAFVLHFSQSDLFNKNSLTFNELKFVQIEGLGNAGEVQPPLEVIGGQIDLRVNLDWPKTFLIPKQTNQFWGVSSFESDGKFIADGYGVLTNSPPTK